MRYNKIYAYPMTYGTTLTNWIWFALEPTARILYLIAMFKT